MRGGDSEGGKERSEQGRAVVCLGLPSNRRVREQAPIPRGREREGPEARSRFRSRLISAACIPSAGFGRARPAPGSPGRARCRSAARLGHAVVQLRLQSCVSARAEWIVGSRLESRARRDRMTVSFPPVSRDAEKDACSRADVSPAPSAMSTR